MLARLKDLHDGVTVPSATPALRLIEKWAAHRGDGSSRTAGVFVDARLELVIRIHHGSAPIFVRDLGKCLMVLGVIDLPGAVRTKLAGATEADRGRFIRELREILTSCPRVGFGLAPRDARDPSELDRLILDQTFQIAENDPGSFNRFCDAIQETETILLRVAELMERYVEQPAASLAYTSSTPPPTELYQ